MLSGTTFTALLLVSSNCPSVASNNTLVLTLVSYQSDGSDEPLDALKISLISFFNSNPTPA